MFRGDGDSEEAWPEDVALFSDDCSAARGSRRSMAPDEGEGIEQGDVAKDGGSAWMVMAGKKEDASAESVNEFSKTRSSESAGLCTTSKFVADVLPVSRSTVGEMTLAKDGGHEFTLEGFEFSLSAAFVSVGKAPSAAKELAFVVGCAPGSGVRGGTSKHEVCSKSLGFSSTSKFVMDNFPVSPSKVGEMTLTKAGWSVWMVMAGKEVEGSDEWTGFCSTSEFMTDILSASPSKVGETASAAEELASVVGCALGSCVKRGISV